MNRKLTSFLVLISISSFAFIACQSPEDKIKENQKNVCRDQIQAGQEPTQFCLSLLPEYRSIASPPSYVQSPPVEYQQAQQPIIQQAPAQSQPIIQQVPVPVQQQDNSLRDMALGGIIGHALSGGSSRNYYQAPAQPIVNRTINRTIIQQAPVVRSAPAAKPNYMDTSKFRSSSSSSFSRSRK